MKKKKIIKCIHWITTKIKYHHKYMILTNKINQMTKIMMINRNKILKFKKINKIWSQFQNKE